MANRLSKIYTRSGDQGTTSLANGQRVSKTDLRIETIGTIDELNSVVGLFLSAASSSKLNLKSIETVQHQLFDLGGELAIADSSYQVINQDDITFLENQLDEWNSQLPPLKEFILPGGTTAACYAHLARSTCRRAERCIIGLQSNEEGINAHSVAYLNRLSDLFFVLSRIITLSEGEKEILWARKADR